MAVSLAAVSERQRVRVGWRTRIAPTWEFDIDAIARASRELGVDGSIEVGCAEYANGRWGGMYSYERGVHRIRIKRAYPPERASAVLWHELTHAAQQTRGERERDAGLTRLARRDPDAYDSHPREVEAQANEARAADCPLVCT